MELSTEEIKALLGEDCFALYRKLDSFITGSYTFLPEWSKGGKYGTACVRYKRSGKSLCTMYLRPNQLGVWIILGKDERARYEARAEEFSAEIREKYDTTEALHDGKWLTFDAEDDRLYEQFALLLTVKKKPNLKK